MACFLSLGSNLYRSHKSPSMTPLTGVRVGGKGIAGELRFVVVIAELLELIEMMISELASNKKEPALENA